MTCLGREPICPGWKDAALLNLAESAARILLTLDRDYWQIAGQRQVPLRKSGVVLFRVHPATRVNTVGSGDRASQSRTWQVNCPRLEASARGAALISIGKSQIDAEPELWP